MVGFKDCVARHQLRKVLVRGEDPETITERVLLTPVQSLNHGHVWIL